MKKEIKDFNTALELTLDSDFFVFQRISGSNGTTYKTSLIDLKEKIIENEIFALTVGAGLSLTTTNKTWHLINTARADQLLLLAGAGIQVARNGVEWTITSIAQTPDLDDLVSTLQHKTVQGIFPGLSYKNLAGQTLGEVYMPNTGLSSRATGDLTMSAEAYFLNDRVDLGMVCCLMATVTSQSVDLTYVRMVATITTPHGTKSTAAQANNSNTLTVFCHNVFQFSGSNQKITYSSAISHITPVVNSANGLLHQMVYWYTAGDDGTVEPVYNKGKGYFAACWLLDPTKQGWEAQYSGSVSNEIDALNFLTETVYNPLCVLSTARVGIGAVASSIKGYFAGGRIGPYGFSASHVLKIIDGMNFSTETAINHFTNLSENRHHPFSLQSSTKGYFAGGWKGSHIITENASLSSIDRLTFSSETMSILSAHLSIPRRHGANVSSATKGYAAGGVQSSLGTTRIDGIVFTSETAFVSTAVLKSVRFAFSGIASTTKGYFGGGVGPVLNAADNVFYSEILQYVFATETSLNATAYLSIKRYGLAGASAVTKGYFAGGWYESGEPLMSNAIDGLDFVTDTAINPSATLRRTRYSAKGISCNEQLPITLSTKGYFAGGWTGSATETTPCNSNKIDALSFATNTAVASTAVLTVARRIIGGVNSSDKGYFGGGNIGTYQFQSSAIINAIDGIIFASETVFDPSATLRTTRYGMGTVSSTTRGYFGGGSFGNYDDSVLNLSNVIDTLVFASETSAGLSATLHVARHTLAGVSSATRGYFGGGTITGTEMSDEIDGITFASNTAFNISITLSVERRGLAGVSSTTKGYFAGGWNTITNMILIDGLDFSSESALVFSATLSLGRRFLAGIQSSANGYFGGGNTGLYEHTQAEIYTDIDGVNFATSTAFNPSTTLSVARTALTGVNP